MDWRGAALGLAGAIGCATAVFHGVLIQRLMVEPFAAMAEGRMSRPIRRLAPPLLQFSTYNWLLGGVALMAAARWAGPDVRLATGLLVGSSYLFGALANAWGTRGRHPGWMLMAAAVGLIAVGLVP